MIEQERYKWLGAVSAFVFIVVFAWMRWRSGLWHYRWAGFFLGIAFAVTFVNRQAMRASYDIAKRYDIPGRANLLGGIAFIALGAITLRRFFLIGSGDDGFFGVVLLASAIHEGFVYRWISRKDDTGLLTDDQRPRLNHG
jgi:hypothetical protein